MGHFQILDLSSAHQQLCFLYGEMVGILSPNLDDGRKLPTPFFFDAIGIFVHWAHNQNILKLENKKL